MPVNTFITDAQATQKIQEAIVGISGGYQGSLMISDTPTADGVYFPVQEGAYPNAGGLSYLPNSTDTGYSVQFAKTGSNWEKISTELNATDAEGSVKHTYEINELGTEILEVEDELNVLGNNLKPLYSTKISQVSDLETIPLKNSNGGKMILSLHKTVNNGYETDNDAYLPNAKDDFSDVRITNQNGEVLGFMPIYKGNIDILPDARMAKGSMLYVDSNNYLYGRRESKIQKSTDDGITWSELTIFNDLVSPTISYIINDDTIFVGSKGKLYRSEVPYTSKTEVLDFNIYHANSTILSHSIVVHPDGEMFIGTYQNEWDCRIFKSIDNGVNWAQVYQTTDYQHVHQMSIDIYQTPIAIYAGLDGGGGVLRTTDKGDSWDELRGLYPSMPQASDYGIIYSDPTGYRLLGGETSIVGGHSILKTTDDQTFTPVLSTGHGVYFIKRLGNKLFAGGISSNSFKTGAIYVSEDDGDSWKTAYSTSFIDEYGASNAYRYLSYYNSEIIVGCQSVDYPALRIVEGGTNYFAQVIVDVPVGSTSINVESGYLTSYVKNITNDFETGNDIIVSISLNENSNVNKIVDNEVVYQEKDFEYVQNGKTLGTFFPKIQRVKDKYTAKREAPSHFDVNMDLTQGDFNIGFWYSMSYLPYELNLIASTTQNLKLINGYQMFLNGTRISSITPSVKDQMFRVDINFDSSGQAKLYVNGRELNVDPTSLSDINTWSGYLKVLEVIPRAGFPDPSAIQHFTISKGVITADQALNNYYANLFDNKL